MFGIKKKIIFYCLLSLDYYRSAEVKESMVVIDVPKNK